MWKAIVSFVQGILGMSSNFVQDQLWSFNTKEQGNSAAKTTVFVMICMIVYCHKHFVDKTNFESILVYDMAFSILLLGIAKPNDIFDFIISWKHGRK